MSIWLVRGDKQNQEVALEEGVSYVGFHDAPNLSAATSRDAVLRIVRSAYPDASENRAAHYGRQLFAFAHRIEVGDVVAMPLRGRPQIALGRVTGNYRYRTDLGSIYHTRPVEWVRPGVTRSEFGQDLLYSLGAFMTVGQIQRNDAEQRIRAILAGRTDPGPSELEGKPRDEDEGTSEEEAPPDVEQIAHDQILGHLQKNFKGHALARLVDAVLQAEGYETELATPGPDGGVDILAGGGALGFENPRLCVQVKSSGSPADVTVLRTLVGSMANFKADQGLLVSWGGFNSAVQREARLSFFSVRLWSADDLVNALLRNYDKLPEELQSELPLKRIWALVLEE